MKGYAYYVKAVVQLIWFLLIFGHKFAKHEWKRTIGNQFFYMKNQICFTVRATFNQSDFLFTDRLERTLQSFCTFCTLQHSRAGNNRILRSTVSFLKQKKLFINSGNFLLQTRSWKHIFFLIIRSQKVC